MYHRHTAQHACCRQSWLTHAHAWAWRAAPAASRSASSASEGSQEEPKEEPPTARTLFAIASSPYNARRDSANLDASIIEAR
jgi:hypothetical protein